MTEADECLFHPVLPFQPGIGIFCEMGEAEVDLGIQVNLFGPPLGFRSTGEEYLEDRIPDVKMVMGG